MSVIWSGPKFSDSILRKTQSNVRMFRSNPALRCADVERRINTRRFCEKSCRENCDFYFFFFFFLFFWKAYELGIFMNSSVHAHKREL